MYGMPKRRGRSKVDVQTRPRRRSSSRGSGSIVPGLPVRTGVGASQDFISASPNLRRSSSRSKRRGGSRRRSRSGPRVADVGDSSRRRRRRSRRASPELRVQGKDDAARALGEGVSPSSSAGLEEVAAAATAATAADAPQRRAYPELRAQGRDDAARALGDGVSPSSSTGLEEVAAAATAAAAAAATTAASPADRAGETADVVGLGTGQGMSFRDERNSMEDQEREALMSSLSAAYTQVNDLTHELKVSLDKLDRLSRKDRASGAEKGLRPLPTQEPQLFSHQSPPLSGSASKKPPKDGNKPPNGAWASEDAITLQKRNTLSEDSPSTPPAVRQLRAEVERLRQRGARGSASEEKCKPDISDMQRHIALLESKLSKPAQDTAAAPTYGSCHTHTTNDNVSSSSRSRSRSSSSSGRSSITTVNHGSHLDSTKKLLPDSAYCTTPGGTRYRDAGETKSLVARVAELEEKLKRSSTEGAKAKQESAKAEQALRDTRLEKHTAKLKGEKLEKSLQKLKNDLAESRAMNDGLQNEVDRLRSLEPEDNAQRSGWQRQWLNGLKQPMSPEPTPIKIHVPESRANDSWRWLGASAPESNPIQASGGASNQSSPAVLVGDLDLDKNRLVYTTDRSQFVYLDYMETK